MRKRLEASKMVFNEGENILIGQLECSQKL